MDELLYRDFQLDRSGLNEEKREITLSFSSETEEVQRWFGIEILDHSSRSVDLSRLKSVGSFIFNHDPTRIIGPIRQAKIENGRGVANVGYDETDEGNLRLAQTKSGSLKGTSFAYRVKQYKELAEGEEYQLAGRTIKGKKDISIFVATRWQPIEITATAVPADSSVGLGRAVTRSLDGIEIERPKTTTFKEELEVDEKDVRKIVDEALAKFGEEGRKQNEALVRKIMEDANKPQLRVEVDVMQDLLNRASAVSLECHKEVSDLLFAGKTEAEALRHINDAVIKNSDATDTGDNKGDGTKRQTTTTKKEDEIPKSFRDISDDDFCKAFQSELIPTFN